MRSRKAPLPSCSAAARSRIVPVAIVATAGAIVRRAASVRASVKKVPPWVRRKKYERATPSVYPSSQELPLLGHQRAEDRLQGRAPSAALRLRARQDRAEPH